MANKSLISRLKKYENFLNKRIKYIENETDEFNVQIGDASELRAYKASKIKLDYSFPELKDYRVK